MQSVSNDTLAVALAKEGGYHDVVLKAHGNSQH